MQPYIELNAHHIGKSHIQGGLSCEDFSAAFSDEHVSIVVISDGHGDKNCFRSDKGARYACEIAISLCRQFQNITSHIDDINQCDFESLVVSLESDIADSWKEKVLSDAYAHPFSDDELTVATEDAQIIYKNGQRLEKAYGCTLILSMTASNYWLSIQIGDGKSIAAFTDGVFVEPIPIDENCLGNRSTSLCNSNAKESFRHYYSKIKPIAAFVSSDGVEESFDQAGLYNFFFSIAYWLKEEGFDNAKAKVEDLLPQISDGGSGDDVSVAFMVSTEDVIVQPRQTLDQIYDRVNACENALVQCRVLFANTNDQISEKRKACADLEKEIANLKTELEEKEKIYTETQAEQSSLQQLADELELKTKRASEQMEKANKYKASAERFWFAEFDKIGLKYHLPLEESETDVLDRKTDSTENSQNIRKINADLSTLKDDTKEMISSPIVKENQSDMIKQRNPVDLAEQIEINLYDNLKKVTGELTKELPQEESKDRPAKHFWSFGKQS